MTNASRPNHLRDCRNSGDDHRGHGMPSSTPAPATFSSLEQADKYQWLEDVSGERSMTWVKAQNARTVKVLESDPRFAGLKEAALQV